LYFKHSGTGSVVGIATGYGLDGPGIESRWRRDFPHVSTQALGPTQPPVQWVPGLSWGKGRPGREADPSPSSSAVGHKRVELYLYSPYGPYGLYRASMPAQGCTLPFILNTMGCPLLTLHKRHVWGRIHQEKLLPWNITHAPGSYGTDIVDFTTLFRWFTHYDKHPSKETNTIRPDFGVSDGITRSPRQKISKPRGSISDHSSIRQGAPQDLRHDPAGHIFVSTVKWLMN
jgi:hypothetical protein